MQKLRKFINAKERRQALEKQLKRSFPHLAQFAFDEQEVAKKNCENLIGSTQLPLGVAGPLPVKYPGRSVQSYFIPLATTEGALVASVNRGCKAISKTGGAIVFAERVGTTRGPVFATAGIAAGVKFRQWLQQNFAQFAEIAKRTSSHLQLLQQDITRFGRNVFIRFYFDTQDAMGMNMATIATQKIVEFIEKNRGIKCISIAGNFDIDKKPAWLNFINPRGFSAWAEVVLPAEIVQNVLKVDAASFFETWLAKCMLGSAMSGALGFNAHYANIVAALFIATGQDPAHVVEGSLGITTTKLLPKGALYFSVYLPALLVGTVGGGTGLSSQKEALSLLGVAGGKKGGNAQKLAALTAGAVLAGELSLLASETEGSLARVHQQLGR